MDSDEYFWMVYKFHINAPVDQSAPWVYRIATPWLASFGTEKQIADGTAFFAINLMSSLLIALLLVPWLRNFIASFAIRVLVIVLFLTEWHAPTRFHLLPSDVCRSAVHAVLAHRLPRHRSHPSLAVGVGGATDDADCVARNTGSRINDPGAVGVHQCSAADVPAVGAVPSHGAGMALRPACRVGYGGVVHAWIRIASEPVHSERAIPRQMLEEKPLFTWVLAWFFTFGPSVVALVIADASRARQFLRDLTGFRISARHGRCLWLRGWNRYGADTHLVVPGGLCVGRSSHRTICVAACQRSTRCAVDWRTSRLGAYLLVDPVPVIQP